MRYYALTRHAATDALIARLQMRELWAVYGSYIFVHRDLKAGIQ